MKKKLIYICIAIALIIGAYGTFPFKTGYGSFIRLEIQKQDEPSDYETLQAESVEKKTDIVAEPVVEQTEKLSYSGVSIAYADAVEPPPRPVKLYIPSISLVSPIQAVGLNTKGEMDVPSGDTNNVGWYEYGTSPGEVGSAVLDAHVFAAFKNLYLVKVGDDITMQTDDGVLRFVVEEVSIYDLPDVPREKLFNRSDKPRLNLITCAGTLTADGSTYDQRLIVYAKLAD
ncbi:MAG: hypothetical protein A3H57_02945 [Candidatus Taylorbacteria bacterium RIFCSPLOWO2_02_FULL_43_11]|uniref:Class F sortase n=1 Tax=Candidatus Taylorbacteria bacterium RIFCSPHIGHO2_02_FULL_43_32b TaxID=1802306 RepID=A0A1G2MLZ8_9BACT|nr:MAG: hypothetical protein A2743_03300 [Candidatus Taylorbacteria bacterium RIFCSPHIGHO2_01_FULL_43_47]OHA24868.1 MAG: hypothetical protein A3C72_04865 [Candidatus Taylorbacteria bacterium RIFCSPHIGHO2_02_FULL_43_32b]OHA37388.1 MAG: hypothetical protein A3H57_02945 [Candidatus Taylorbacteria bacterium RIFCSPLOWO2_02_FULL_43_11]